MLTAVTKRSKGLAKPNLGAYSVREICIHARAFGLAFTIIREVAFSPRKGRFYVLGIVPRKRHVLALMRAPLVWAFVICVAGSPAVAQAQTTDRAAITERLQRWAHAFNNRNSARTCDLFAPDLIATVLGSPDRGRTAVCAQLASALARTDRHLYYKPHIKEIIVSGNLAIVRLVWTLTVEHGTTRHVSYESGIDVFRKGSGSRWDIIRFIAFSSDIC